MNNFRRNFWLAFGIMWFGIGVGMWRIARMDGMFTLPFAAVSLGYLVVCITITKKGEDEHGTG